MLKSLKITSGYAAELESLKDRTFELPGDKINVLFGPNGCGKTTILKILAAYTGLDHSNKRYGGGGWSGPPLKSFLRDNPQFPKDFESLTPGKCKAKVEWDGAPVFYNSATLGDDLNMSYIIGDVGDSPDGMMSGMEQMSLIVGHHSEGELRTYKVGKVIEAMEKANWHKPYAKAKTKRNLDQKYAAYVRSLRGRKRKFVPTLLWDEPDRSLSIESQIKVWVNVLPFLLNEGLQVVVASHSAIIPLLPNFRFINIIDVDEGYVERSRLHLIRILKSRTDEEKQNGPAPGNSRPVRV